MGDAKRKAKRYDKSGIRTHAGEAHENTLQKGKFALESHALT
jgi:hypothetical protein